MKICPECQRKNLNNAKTCDRCGASLIKAKKKTRVSENKIISTKTGKTDNVVISDIKIPFWSMVRFVVMLVIASIPAIVIVALIILLCFTIAGGLGNFINIFLKEFLDKL